MKVNRNTLILPIAATLILTACGSGNDSAEVATETSSENTGNVPLATGSVDVVDNTDELMTTVGDDDNTFDDEVSDDSSGQAPDEISTVTPNETETSNPGEADPVIVVPDPLVQNTTRIDFGITVPAYSSTSLQVRLVWGNKDIAVDWVGDGVWSVADDFPTDTENLLSVSFVEGNGNIALGRYETNFRTGTNSAQSIQITACLLYTSDAADE